MRFRSKERGTRVKDRAKNGASKRAGRGWGRKEENACRQTPGFGKPPTWPVMPEFAHRNLTQGPEEMCLLLEHQNPSKTSEKMGYFDRVTVSLHIL